MYKNKKTLIIFIILLVIFLIVGQDQYYYARGDYFTPIDPYSEIMTILNLYNFNLYGGFDWSFKAAELPIYIYYTIFSFLKPILAFYLLITIINYFSYKGIYRLLCDYTKIPNGNITIIFLSIIYCFSPYLTALAPPGHYHAYIFYAISPWVLFYLKRSIYHNFGKVFILLFLAGPGFGNVAFIILFSLVLVIHLLFNTKNIKEEFKKILLVYFILIISNSYWLIPYLININEAINLNISGLSSLSGSYKIATHNASIINILLGVPENMFYMSEIYNYINYFKIYSILMIPIAALFICSINNKSKWLFLYAIILIVLMKGGTYPFPNILQFIFDNFQFAKIIRRPLSKLWGIYYLLFIIILALKYSNINKHHYKIIFGISAILNVILFVFINNWTGSTLPEVYKSINAKIGKNEGYRVLLLPGTKGVNPVYERSGEKYHNYDYINIVLNSATIRPDSSDISLENNYKKNIKMLYTHSNICDNLKLNSINYILYDKNIISDPVEIKMANKYIDSKYINLVNVEDNVLLYSVSDQCTRPIYDNMHNIHIFGINFSNILYGNNFPTYTNFSLNNNFSAIDLGFLGKYYIYYPTIICLLILFIYIFVLLYYAIKNLFSYWPRIN